MGTPLQNVYDQFHANMSGVNFMGADLILASLFSRANTICEKNTSVSLKYSFDNNYYAMYIMNISKCNGKDFILKVDKDIYNIVTYDLINSEDLLDRIYKAVVVDYPKSTLFDEELKIFRNDENTFTVEVLQNSGIDYVLAPSFEGSYENDIEDYIINLVATYWTNEWYKSEFSKLDAVRNYIGTKEFDRLPDKKKNYDIVKDRSEYWYFEAMRQKDHLNTYGY